MTHFIEIFNALVVENLKQVKQVSITYSPKVLLTIIILVVGWVCALLIRKIVVKLLKAFGLDVVAQKAGIRDFFKKGGVEHNLSALIGRIFYWLIIVTAFTMAFNTLGLTIVTQFIENSVSYIPKIVIAIILLAVGLFLGRFAGQFVETTARLAQIPIYVVLSKITQYVVVALGGMLALEYLNATVVLQYAVIIFAVVPLVILIVFLLGGRELVLNMLSRYFLKRNYAPGDIIQINAVTGEIISIDFISTKLKQEQEELIIPNTELIKHIVKKQNQTIKQET